MRKKIKNFFTPHHLPDDYYATRYPMTYNSLRGEKMAFIDEIKSLLKIPEIESFKRVLVVQPHPDDAEIAIGGIVAKLSDMGSDVFYVTVTDGSLGTKDLTITREKLKEIRKREQEEAASILGVKDTIWLGFEDGGDYDYLEVRSKLVKIIRELKPDLILTVDPTLRYEFHPDHLKTGKATAEAVMFYHFPHFENPEGMEVISSVKGLGFFFTPLPNIFVCVDEYREKKVEAISKHKSQFSGEGMKTLLWYLEKKEKAQGEKIGCEYAESIRLMLPIMLHAFAESEVI
jgi:LmbE family N-acetylglucosaminyl deacetylase